MRLDWTVSWTSLPVKVLLEVSYQLLVLEDNPSLVDIVLMRRNVILHEDLENC